MDYRSNLNKLSGRIPVAADCLDYLSARDIPRFAIVSACDSLPECWFHVFDTEEEALEFSEGEVRGCCGWMPVWLVDLSDNSARDIHIDVRIGIGELIA